jgi:hypothetical protein
MALANFAGMLFAEGLPSLVPEFVGKPSCSSHPLDVKAGGL